MKILNEQGKELNQEGLDYEVGYLTQSSDDVFAYHLFDAKQLAERKIPQLKEKLAETDYQAIKYAEGEMSANDYEPIKEQRRQWRAEINRLEELLNG